MVRPTSHPWVLALAHALVACKQGSDSSPPPDSPGLAVQSISAPDFGRWECNRPIEFAFDERIDFASVSARSIRIRTSVGVPAAGTFAARAIDADDDGAPEGTDERVIVFYPRCPEADDLSDAGFTPGVRYLVTLAGEDRTQNPDELVRSVSGRVLAQTVVQAFETIADPAGALHDERAGPPVPRVRAAGASVGSGCHLELGEDPSRRVFFEGGPASGRTPSGFGAPLNLLGDRSTHVAVVVVFDQPVHPAPGNIARLRLEYNERLEASGWVPLETRAELLSNCRPDDVAVRLVPLGTFPPGGFVRARIEAGFQDRLGQATPDPSAEFAIAEVATVGFTSLVPAGAIADELHEEFDFGAGSPLSFVDLDPPLDRALAEWRGGELRASSGLVLPPELREFDWLVSSGQVFVFDTTATRVLGGPGGVQTIAQDTLGGRVQVRNLTVQEGGEIRVRGPNPFEVHASGSVVIRGSINASGSDAPDSFLGTQPAVGGTGSAGGGSGGAGRGGASPRGSDGTGAFGGAGGGGGGESGFAPESLGFGARRGGGGGGGRFARDQGALIAENGGDGPLEGRGVESGLSPTRGGAAGAEVFTDGDPSNDFFGVQPVVDASGAVVARRRGELDHVHAGSGGGNAGDSIVADSLPLPSFPALLEGGGGGGGGGAVVIRALGPILFGKNGQIRANGGRGGRSMVSLLEIGGPSGGSGSGGHAILESADSIDFTDGNPLARARPWILAIGGPRIFPQQVVSGFGGAGGPGVVQLHVPHPERALDDPESNLILPGVADPFLLCQPRAKVLYPTIGSRSSAQSRWVPLGAAGEGGAAGPESVVAFLFDGIETARGEHQGKVRTIGGRVVELPPLLGPLPVTEAGVELLSDGISLALSGSALAPLRASAQPISKDVYLRTPALLEGFTLRFANATDPGRRKDFVVARARYDDAASELTLTLGGLLGTLAEAAGELGGPEAVELSLLPRFFRVRQGSSGADLLPDSRTVRILFQGAADDGTSRPDELHPLVDWTADVAEFGALAPGALDFLRFRVEFELDAHGNGFDSTAEPTALDFLRLPFRF